MTEAINSLLRWYKQADRCYVYFNDVSSDKGNAEDENLHTQLRRSHWFKRGWTLQELLAPRSLQRYDKDWKWFGDRTSLSEQISAATGISDAHLSDQSTTSVAMKLSWAANRQTSRIEDIAYSLLGIFDINMLMMYGEGENAFQRLQRKIIKRTDDETIFAWSSKDTSRPNGMLAPSPAAFANCGGIKRSTDGAAVRLPYAMTNKGLELYVNLPNDSGHKHIIDRQDVAIEYGLNCERRLVPKGEGQYLVIRLEKFGDRWQRVNCDQPCLYKSEVKTVWYLDSVAMPAETKNHAGASGFRAIYIAQ